MGKVIIFSAPSGAGKTTIVHHLLSTLDSLEFSISATTRPPRPGEQNGKDYYFLSNESFAGKIENGEFLEFEEVYEGVYYGTLKSEIDRIWKGGKAVVFDVDVKGGLNLKKYFGSNALAVFVAPPSLEILEERLRGRKTETAESLKKRLDKAAYEMQFESRFDVTLVNKELHTTFARSEELVISFLENKQ